MIKLQVIGNLGRDCVTKEINGRNVINFSVAHTERFKTSAGTQQEKTIWVECAYWTDRLGIAPYLVKGQTVYVEGSPEVDAFKRQDGEPGATLRLRVRDIQLVGAKSTDTPAGSSYSQPSASAAGKTASEPIEQDSGADDLPF